jgi:hypothetical protein
VGEAPSLAAAALAFGLRVITFDQGLYQEMIAYEGQHSGLLMPMADMSGTIVDHLVKAMQEYLMEPELRVSFRKTARALVLILRAVSAATSWAGGRGSVRAGIGTRLARSLALPECLRETRAKYKPADNNNSSMGLAAASTEKPSHIPRKEEFRLGLTSALLALFHNFGRLLKLTRFQ